MNDAVGRNAPSWLCIESRAYETAHTIRNKKHGYVNWGEALKLSGISRDRLSKSRRAGEIRTIWMGEYLYLYEDVIASRDKIRKNGRPKLQTTDCVNA